MVRLDAKLDRRRFLQLGAAASGLTLGCDHGPPSPGRVPPATKMRSRKLGRTELIVSELTFGAHGVDNPPLMKAALDAGVTTFFTSGSYLDGREEMSLGKALKSLGVRPRELVIVTGTKIRQGMSRQRILQEIEASLGRLGTDHLNVFTTFEVCSAADLRVDELYEAAEEAQRAGKIGHLALSGHCGGMEPCLKAAIADGRFDVLLFKYDFVSYSDVAAILRKAAERGIGAIVFKTNAGNRTKEIRELEAEGLSFRCATVKWALANPDISSVAVTITNFDQIRDLTAAIAAPLSSAEIAMLGRYADAVAHEYCRFCTICEACCPHGVAVAEVMRYDMYFSGYGREKEAMQRYQSLSGSQRAIACADCSGLCDGACPFGRRVREGLLAAHRNLSLAEA